jgi:hypothetical protein
MRLHTFGVGAAFHNTNEASDFELAPLIGSGGQDVRLHVFHFGPGQYVGSHATSVNQLFCVVSGDGWVTGAEGVQTPITAGEAAHWRVGEVHAAGTEATMSAIVVEGAFKVIAPLVRR